MGFGSVTEKIALGLSDGAKKVDLELRRGQTRLVLAPSQL